MSQKCNSLPSGGVLLAVLREIATLSRAESKMKAGKDATNARINILGKQELKKEEM